jgi:outer membrane receptor protein involved in Fe transport
VHATVRAVLAVVAAIFAVGPFGAAAAEMPATLAQAASVQVLGTLTGTVTDSTGVPLAGAAITAKGPMTASATSDAHGAYTLTINAGVYDLTAVKAGYNGATQTDVAVAPGTTTTLNVSLTAITFTSLKEIGRVRVASGRSAFNTSAASVATISNQTFVDQGQIQVQRVLDQTPGIVVDHPGTSATNASPGAITFPSIRGGLGFETASLIDGHPLSVQTFGDYVTTFLNSYVLQSAEVIKGPGATAPETYYSINGTVNFRTLDPTATFKAQIDQGLDSYGGQFSNYRVSDSILKNEKLGFVLDYAIDGTPGPLKDAAGYVTLPSGTLIDGRLPTGFTTNAITSGSNAANINNPFAATATLLACCNAVNQNYVGKTELAKFRYRFSDATVATVSYLGSQTYTDQNGNHVYTYPTLFTPAAGYSGALSAGLPVTTYQNVFFPANEYEINNEPIFQGDIRTTVGKDTILGRYYTASINRLQYNTLGNPNANDIENLALNGSVSLCPAGYTTFAKGLCGGGPAGQPPTAAPVPTFFDGRGTHQVTLLAPYFRSSEEDKLHGGSFEYDHFFGESGNVLSLAFDQTNANTDSYSLSGRASGPPSASYSIYGGEKVRYSTYLLRAIVNVTPQLKATLANYYDNYSQTYTIDGGNSFKTSTYGRYDGRLGLEYRPNRDVAIRASAGSALAPPYLALLTAGPPTYTLDASGAFATDRQNLGNLKAETAFGYDLGADIRIGSDGATVLSTDLYLNNLKNQFISSTLLANGTVTVCSKTGGGTTTVPPCAPGQTPVTVPLFTTTSANLDDARYEGIELALNRDPSVGFGFTAQGALIRGYPYDVSPCTYSNKPSCSNVVTNLGIIANANFYGSGTGGQNGTPSNGAGNNFNSVNNHAIPYSQGYAEIHYRTPRGGYVAFGEQYYGPNNSLNVPAFFVANASLRFPFPNGFAFQMSADNLFGAYNGATIAEDGGVAVPLANGQNGLTNANVIGPRLFRFTLSKKFGN